MHLDKHGSDKRPEYMAVYERICDTLPEDPAIVELGVLNGESLKMWLAAFPDSTVIGVDNDPAAHWPDGAVRVVADQTECAQDIGAPGDTFDLIIDDASHQYKATMASFQALWPLVEPGGWYVVEDWDASLRYPHEGAYWAMETVPRNLARRMIYGDPAMAEVVIVPGLMAVRKAGA